MRLLHVSLVALALLGFVETQGSEVVQSKVNPIDGLRYIHLPEGDYMSGCSAGDKECFTWEKQPKRLHVKSFWIGETEVTQRAYEKVIGNNPSLYQGADRPVDRVGWTQAQAFCQAVGMRLRVEWEYAARGGSAAPRYGPLDQIAWYDGNSNDQTHPVALKLPNAYGLYDMLGNVWEWVQDSYEIEPGKRILRGDSFYNTARQVRVSDRLWATPDTAHRDMGFRCAGD